MHGRKVTPGLAINMDTFRKKTPLLLGLFVFLDDLNQNLVMKKLFSFALMALALASCRKKALPENPIPNTPIDSVGAGTMKVSFHNKVDSQDLVLNRTEPYAAPDGDEYSVRTFNYYISNVVFVDASGNRFAENESYHLIRAEEPSSLSFSISQMPSGNYVAMEFLIGVDSARNVSGAQTGDLSPDYGMFWTWKTGYIMAKMEGTLQSNGFPLIYHIAGFSKPYYGIRKVTLPLSTNAIVANNKETNVQLNANLNTWFAAPGFPGFSAVGIITSTSPTSSAIADNYVQMFTIASVKNP
ncbi:MAG: hypothetical protein QM702_20225 [Rubrivivax sp.]